MPFNAAAVLANSRRWQSDPRGRGLLPHLFAVDAPRPDEVRFLLDQPVPDLAAAARLAAARDRLARGARAAERAARPLPPGRGRLGHAAPSSPGPAGRRRLELSTRSPAGGGARSGSGPRSTGSPSSRAPQPGQRFRLLAGGDRAGGRPTRRRRPARRRGRSAARHHRWAAERDRDRGLGAGNLLSPSSSPPSPASGSPGSPARRLVGGHTGRARRSHGRRG